MRMLFSQIDWQSYFGGNVPNVAMITTYPNRILGDELQQREWRRWEHLLHSVTEIQKYGKSEVQKWSNGGAEWKVIRLRKESTVATLSHSRILQASQVPSKYVINDQSQTTHKSNLIYFDQCTMAGLNGGENVTWWHYVWHSLSAALLLDFLTKRICQWLCMSEPSCE